MILSTFMLLDSGFHRITWWQSCPVARGTLCRNFASAFVQKEGGISWTGVGVGCRWALKKSTHVLSVLSNLGQGKRFICKSCIHEPAHEFCGASHGVQRKSQPVSWITDRKLRKFFLGSTPVWLWHMRYRQHIQHNSTPVGVSKCSCKVMTTKHDGRTWQGFK